LLHHAKQELGDKLNVSWRYFSLEQVNNKNGEDWKLWQQPESYPSRARFSFKGAEAARKQGDDAFDRFHLALLAARHVDGKELTERDTIFDAARSAELDVDQFERDFDAANLDSVGRDHEAGVNTYGVFGTPTFVFDGGGAAYLRLRPLPPDSEMMAVWDRVKDVMAERPQILEIKRPVAPVK
jgi:predicted DsbA family dithiol-disulfide isomerase